MGDVADESLRRRQASRSRKSRADRARRRQASASSQRKACRSSSPPRPATRSGVAEAAADAWARGGAGRRCAGGGAGARGRVARAGRPGARSLRRRRGSPAMKRASRKLGGGRPGAAGVGGALGQRADAGLDADVVLPERVAHHLGDPAGRQLAGAGTAGQFRRGVSSRRPYAPSATTATAFAICGNFLDRPTRRRPLVAALPGGGDSAVRLSSLECGLIG